MLFRWAAPVNPPTKKLNHPFDWGSSNQLNDRPQVTLTDGWAWASHPEECSVNGPVLSCNFTMRRTLMKPPPAPTQLAPGGTLAPNARGNQPRQMRDRTTAGGRQATCFQPCRSHWPAARCQCSERRFIHEDCSSWCYIDAYTEPAEPGPNWPPADWPETREQYEERLRNTPTHLCRLRYFGDEERWGFGFFAYSSEKYELSIFPSGEFFGPPEDAFEVSANLYLQ